MFFAIRIKLLRLGLQMDNGRAGRVAWNHEMGCYLTQSMGFNKGYLQQLLNLHQTSESTVFDHIAHRL